MTLTFEPILPPAAWVTLALFTLLVWLWYAAARPKVCSNRLWVVVLLLMAAVPGILLIVLLNPIWLLPLPPPLGKPLLTVLIDESRSMSSEDVPPERSRYAAAVKLLQEAESGLRSAFEIRVHGFASETRPLDSAQLPSDSSAEGTSTDLAGALEEALVADREQGQAVLLLSDGVHNHGGSADQVLRAAETAKARDAPVYTATIGSAARRNDIELRVPRSQELAFVGQSIPVTVQLKQTGIVGDRVQVTLNARDEVLETREVRLEKDGVAEVSFLVPAAAAGLFQYRFNASQLPGEASSDNNAASFQVRVVQEPMRALVVEGKPYWDSKFLLRMLTDDPSLEVDCVVRVARDRFLWRRLQLVDPAAAAAAAPGPAAPERAAGDTAAGAAAAPTAAAPDPAAQPGSSPKVRHFERREQVEYTEDVSQLLQDPQLLRRYQILLLGREAELYLEGAAVENIRDWISGQGGALVCYRGAPVAEPDQQLSRLLPVRWAAGHDSRLNESRFRIQVTERGDDLSWLRVGSADGLQKLPSLAVSAAADSIRPLAVVLGRSGGSAAPGSSAPVLTYQPYGMGRVVVVEGAGMWRWAFLPPDYRELDSTYAILWQSLLRWLVSSGGLLPGEELALQMDRVTFTAGEPVSAVVLRRPEGDSGEIPGVELRDENGTLLQSVNPVPVGEELGVYQVPLGQLPAGRYQLHLPTSEDTAGTAKQIHFDVRPDLRELLEVSARSDLMARIAELSGGQVVQNGQLEGIKDSFDQYLRRSRPVQYQRRTAWDRWWVLTGILVIWSGTWALRRRIGLI